METGCANSFVEQTLRWEVRRGLKYETYTVFRTEFVAKFCPANEASTAIVLFELQKYYQGSRDVDSYIDEFEGLVEILGYTDPIAIVLKFCRGLNPSIQN